jgi:hypothetical protein
MGVVIFMWLFNGEPRHVVKSEILISKSQTNPNSNVPMTQTKHARGKLEME